MFWMITNRNIQPGGFGDEFSELSYWTNATGPVDDFNSWTRAADADSFKNLLVAVVATFPDPVTTPPENQKHVTFFVHGFNEPWDSACRRYEAIVQNLYTG